MLQTHHQKVLDLITVEIIGLTYIPKISSLRNRYGVIISYQQVRSLDWESSIVTCFPRILSFSIMSELRNTLFMRESEDGGCETASPTRPTSALPEVRCFLLFMGSTLLTANLQLISRNSYYNLFDIK